jgi:cytochrome b involved in lipid metabolism
LFSQQVSFEVVICWFIVMKLPAILFCFSACCILTRGFAPVHHVARPPSFAIRTIQPKSVELFHHQNTTDPQSSRTAEIVPIDRFHREASKTLEIQEPCIIYIHGNRYNLTAWANAHPGGARILQKFNDKDASKAFEAAHHSISAYDMLKDFRIDEEAAPALVEAGITTNLIRTAFVEPTKISLRSRLRHKLFTREDPIGVHKYLGILCLINFIGRYRQMYFGDPAAGLGSRGHPWFSIISLLPHGLLSMSSLIFHTVPRERVVGKPMIWQEFRIHNIIFGERSVLTGLAAALAVKAGNTPIARKWAVGFSCACVLLSIYGADLATEKLRAVEVESTTATMPYWEGCSIATQKRFKSFYAYCQFMATLSCMVS